MYLVLAFDLIENYVVPFDFLTLTLACGSFHELDDIMVDYP